jgi:aryl-alcohol dehydrogenase-like predicted oxidoreductase
LEYVNFGRTGLKVSKIGLGCLGFGSPAWMPWILDEAASRPILTRALDAGINFFDTADMYSLGVGEAVVGRVLLGQIPRDRLVIASKVFFPQSLDPNDWGLSRKHIFRAIDRTLTNLGTDHVDIYQIHRFDYSTPMEETLEALHDVVKAGKVRYLGASTMKAWQFAKMIRLTERNGWTGFASMQPQYSLIHREEERDMLPLCADEGIAVIPWGPLAGGFLTGRYSREQRADTARANHNSQVGRGAYSEADYDVADAVNAVARARGCKPAVVALAWHFSKPEVTAPIVGASKLEHLDDALAAESLRLTDDEVRQLEAPYRPKPHVGASKRDVEIALERHRETVVEFARLQTAA